MTLIHTWPLYRDQQWAVALRKNSDGKLDCRMLTGQVTLGRLIYAWGFGEGADGKFGFVISDTTPAAVEGDSIRVAIDGVTIGDFAVMQRGETSSGYSWVIAVIPPDDEARIKALFPMQGSIKLVTKTATYSGKLVLPLFQFNQCITEAKALAPVAATSK